MELVCDFPEVASAGEYRCSRCGAVVRTESTGEIIRRCDAIPLNELAPQSASAPRGLGDTIARVATALGADRVVQVIERWTGKGCGCAARQQWLNQRFPFREQPGALASSTTAHPTLLLRFGHGLGDAVQLTTVLLHLRALFPVWQVDVACKLGAHSLFRGLCRNVYLLEDCPPSSAYDVARTLDWFEPEECYPGMPSTKAERCLREVFRIEPVRELCRYHIEVDDQELELARGYLREVCHISGIASDAERLPVVLLHYQGNSARRNKNLDERLAAEVCRTIRRRGHVPVVIDFDHRSRIADQQHVFNPGVDHPLWKGSGTGDAATLAALMRQSALVVGIDSGPLHVAGACDVPTLAVWTRHHPVHYYGLAKRVTHLVPRDHTQRLRGDRAIGERVFAEHYAHRVYDDLNLALPRLVDEWLSSTDATEGFTVENDFWVRRAKRECDAEIARAECFDDVFHVGELPLRPQTMIDADPGVGAFAERVRQRWSHAELVCLASEPDTIEAIRRNLGASVTVQPGPISSDLIAEVLTTHGWPRLDLLKLGPSRAVLDFLATGDFAQVSQIVGTCRDRALLAQLAHTRFTGWTLRWLEPNGSGRYWLLHPSLA